VLSRQVLKAPGMADTAIPGTCSWQEGKLLVCRQRKTRCGNTCEPVV